MERYNDPAGGSQSTVGEQFNIRKWNRKSLSDAKAKIVFGILSETEYMPKHYGKEIVRYHYLPLLSDANVNAQGIDANGQSVTQEATIRIIPAGNADSPYTIEYGKGEGATPALALTAAKIAADDIFKRLGVFNTDYATTKAALEALADPWVIDDTLTTVPVSGNLYAESTDVGTIQRNLPVLSEDGGDVNGVGFTRLKLRGTFAKFGIHYKYTADSVNFDTDEQLEMHNRRELVRGTVEMSEDILQTELLNNTGITYFSGNALATSEMTGEGATKSLIEYKDLSRLAIDLASNHCDKQNKILTGTRLIDTLTVDSSYIAYIGSELIPVFENMLDNFGNPALIKARHYAAGTKLLPMELGAVGEFRIIVAPKMQSWAGAGAAVVANEGYRSTAGNYDVLPFLVVGNGSFVNIGFQTDGKSSKFKIKHAKPGSSESYARDVYGETGFSSIKWYQGTMINRPEWIAVIKTVAPY